MNKESIMKSDVLDIIFEKRNKNYGAYILRKFYNDRLKKSLGVMILIASGFTAFTFLPDREGYETVIYNFDGPEMGHVKKPETKQPDIKPKTTVPVKNVASTAKWLSMIKIVNNTDLPDKLNSDLDKLAIGNTANINANIGGPVIVNPANNADSGTAEPVKPVIDKTIPITDPDVMPSYPGGMDALQKFLERNLNNPKDMEEGESVSVRIKFVVGYNGKLQSFVTVQDGGEEFNKEVIRVLKKMPEWVPGKSNGENVSVYYTIPVKFVPGN